MNNYSTRIEQKQINTKFLFVDPSYQRQLNPVLVSKIVNHFNPLLVNPIKVSRRSDGRYFVIDGQHTLNALREKNRGKDLMVECKVYQFVGVDDTERRKIEAGLFAEQNGASRTVGTNDKFRARYVAGDKEIVDFWQVTSLTGVRMDFYGHGGANKIVCCAEAYKAYKKLASKDYVEMLQNISAAWGGERDSFRAEIIGGMTLLYLTYGRRIESKTLIRQLSKVSPLVIIRNAKLSNESGKRKYMIEIVNVYNKKLRTNQL